MAVKTEKELNETQRGHWLKAVAAIELRNFGYAISLLQAILKQERERERIQQKIAKYNLRDEQGLQASGGA